MFLLSFFSFGLLRKLQARQIPGQIPDLIDDDVINIARAREREGGGELGASFIACLFITLVTCVVLSIVLLFLARIE